MSSSHFDHIAHVYDHSLPEQVVEHYLDKRARFVIESCPRGDALDVGCGTGVLASRLAAAGYRMSGVDPSEGMLAVLRERAPEVDALQASGTDLPYDDCSFDLVLCVAVLHHVGDPADVRQTLTEMVRVSRPGARVLVWDHNPRNPYWGPLMAKVPQDTGDERLIPEREVVEGLEAGGARILRSAKLGFVPDFTPRALLPAAALLERAAERTPFLRGFAAHNVVLAAKPAQRGA